MNDIPESEKKEIEARHQEASPESSTQGRYVEANAPRAKYYEKNFFECQPALNYGFAQCKIVFQVLAFIMFNF